MSQRQLGKTVAELSFDEAARLIAGITSGIRKGEARDASTGRVIVSSEMDGDDAVQGLAQREAREILPKIDDGREIIITVLHRTTFIQALLRRPPKVQDVFHFKNEPPQYA